MERKKKLKKGFKKIRFIYLTLRGKHCGVKNCTERNHS